MPLRSANLKGNGFDYSGGVPTWYAKEDHLNLTQADYILDFIEALLATPPASQLALDRAAAHTIPNDNTAEPLYQKPITYLPAPGYVADLPPVPDDLGTEPFEVAGGQIFAFGAAEVHLYDGQGHHTGPIPTDRIELGISESSYTTVGDAIFVTVPSGATYSVRVLPRSDEGFDLRIRNIEGLDADLVQRTISYAGVPVGPEGTAELNYAPNTPGNSPVFSLDFDGDGTIDGYMSATGDVGNDLSSDVIPPIVNIDLDGEIGPNGWYVGEVDVTISAVDSDSGVATLAYSVDDGDHIVPYTAPFTVHAASVSQIVARSTDQVGNIGTARVSVGPSSILACNGTPEGFEAGVPAAGWTVVSNQPNGPQWTTVANCGEAGNHTSGAGEAACASSGTFGTAEFDTELRTPVFNLVGLGEARLTYQANYQDWAGIDLLDLDLSTDGGTTWTTILRWDEDHGTFQNTPGENVTVDLTPWIGQANFMLRWRYYARGHRIGLGMPRLTT